MAGGLRCYPRVPWASRWTLSATRRGRKGFRPAFCAPNGSWAGRPGTRVALPSEQRQARTWVFGAPVLLLHTTGRKSGKRRSTPLVYGTYKGTLIVVASNRGAHQAPHWFRNLQANPDVEVWIARHKANGRARIIESGDTDFERLWMLMDEVNFGRYRQLQAASARPIPIVVISPVA